MKVIVNILNVAKGRLDGEGGGENGGCASVCSSKFLISIYFRQNER